MVRAALASMGRKVKRARRAVMVRTAAIAVMVSVPAVRVCALHLEAMVVAVAIVKTAATAHLKGVGVVAETVVIGLQVMMGGAAAMVKAVSKVRPVKVAARLS